jgi:Flp pilus assembly protein TadD
VNWAKNAGQIALLAAGFVMFATSMSECLAQRTAPAAAVDIRIVELQGSVEISPPGATAWQPAQTNQVLHVFDRVHVSENSRAAIRWSDQSVVSFGASTELEVLPPDGADDQAGLHLLRGIVSFFHRDKPGRIHIITRGAVAGVEGTEFALTVNNADAATLSVVEGKVRFGNEQATLVLTNGEQAVAVPGKAPLRTAGFIVNNLLQWCFYYPAVLDPDELPFTESERKELAASLAAYRSGNLLAALKQYPPGRSKVSETERIYHAALVLSVGNVAEAGSDLSTLSTKTDREQKLADSLRQLIAAVKCQAGVFTREPQLASEWLAASYFEQSRALGETSLQNALRDARRAVAVSPRFGFAQARVAELEFSFGRLGPALQALDQSLGLAPRNAQALALEGFLQSAQNDPHEAREWFDRAIAADAALGNAWLGRGLTRIRLGDQSGGREDLLVAAALEPQRAELRSYLGKAYAQAGEDTRAAKELTLAKKLDPNDPTAWLYSALLNQRNNRINDAIRDLEKSQALNDNRSVYRSQLLLDEDQAVRGADLASMYRDAGMLDVSVREASRAVNDDYANYSAHMFLGQSYDQLVDPNGVNLRYETPAESEYLIANLLAPANAGLISSTIAQDDYSQLFERNRFGLASDTEYLSRGAWTQSDAQYGTFDNFSYAAETFYYADPGQWPNGELSERQLSLSAKQQLTPQDSVFFSIQQYQGGSGELVQSYYQNKVNQAFYETEHQDPMVILGYHHDWSPGVHTLFLAGRLQDNTFTTNAEAQALMTFENLVNPANARGPTHVNGIRDTATYYQQIQVDFDIYSAELQQIWETDSHNTIIGSRLQYGDFLTENHERHPSQLAGIALPDPAPTQDIGTLYKRSSTYAYHDWQIFEPLQVIGGITYDQMVYPANYNMAPVSSQESRVGELEPKAGFIWTPADKTTVRFAYTRSLGGVQMDQSYQIEPTEVAGFIQSYRTIIPLSVEGMNSGAKCETFDLSLEQKLATDTYLGASAEMLHSTVDRSDGAFRDITDEYNQAIYGQIPEDLDYWEKTAELTANQLVGQGWSLGSSYRLSQALLNDDFPSFSTARPPVGPYLFGFQPRQRTEGTLQQVDLFTIYNHPSGFFAKGEAVWNGQYSSGYNPAEPGDDFWQFNLYAGYRAFHRRMELTLGLLNLANQNYSLNPLNVYNELPRVRTLTVGLKLNF